MKKKYHTKSKEWILSFFQNHKEQIVSAANIHELLSREKKEMNLATIYRNLDKMTEEGVLMKYKASQEDKAIYQYVGDNEKCHNHLHMQCTKCGKIIHLECGFMKEITEHLFKCHQFGLQCSKSILYGICDNCSNERIEIL